MILEQLGIFGWKEQDENLVLASLLTGDPLLLIGNHGRRLAMSIKTREHIDTFWELIDGLLNALLFVLIGL